MVGITMLKFGSIIINASDELQFLYRYLGGRGIKRDLVSELEHMRLTEANWKEMKLRLTDLKN